MAELTSGLKYERLRELADRGAEKLLAANGSVAKSFQSKDAVTGRWRASINYNYKVILNGKTVTKYDRITLITTVKCYRKGNSGENIAKEQLKDWRSRVLADIAIVKGHTDSATLTVPDYLNQVIDERLSLGVIEASTARVYREYMKYIREGLSDCLISELDYKRIKYWVSSISKTYKPSTVRKAYNVLRVAITEALRSGDLKENPTSGDKKVELPKIRREKPSILDDAATQDVYKLMSDEISDQGPTDNAVCIMLALRGGLRDSEIAGLMWSDCKFERDDDCTITGVVCQIDRAIGRADGGPYVKDVKTMAGKRSLYLPANLANILWSKRMDMAKKALACGVALDDLYVVSPIVPRKRAGSDRIFEDPHWISQRMARAFKAAGIKCIDGAPCTAHALRRTFASVAERSGLSISQLTAVMGHSASNAVTFTHYATTTEATVIDAWQKINAEFNSLLSHEQEPKVIQFKAVNE